MQLTTASAKNMEAKYCHFVAVAMLLFLSSTTALDFTPPGCPTLVAYDVERRTSMCCYPCSNLTPSMELGGAGTCPTGVPKLDSVIGDTCLLKDVPSQDSPLTSSSEYVDFPFDKDGKLIVSGLLKDEETGAYYRDIELGTGYKSFTSETQKVKIEYYVYDKLNKYEPIPTDRNVTELDPCNDNDEFSGTGVKEAIRGMQQRGTRWIVPAIKVKKDSKDKEYPVALKVTLIDVHDSMRCLLNFRHLFTDRAKPKPTSS